MDFNGHKPIYLQIVEQIEDKILLSEWKVDQKIPSVREMAATYGVNPNTVMRSYEALERNEVIYNKRGVGFFVAPASKDLIQSLRKKAFISNELPDFFQKMELLDVDMEEVVKLYCEREKIL